jgi:hypothetical protein
MNCSLFDECPSMHDQIESLLKFISTLNRETMNYKSKILTDKTKSACISINEAHCTLEYESRIDELKNIFDILSKMPIRYKYLPITSYDSLHNKLYIALDNVSKAIVNNDRNMVLKFQCALESFYNIDN